MARCSSRAACYSTSWTRSHSSACGSCASWGPPSARDRLKPVLDPCPTPGHRLLRRQLLSQQPCWSSVNHSQATCWPNISHGPNCCCSHVIDVVALRPSTDGGRVLASRAGPSHLSSMTEMSLCARFVFPSATHTRFEHSIGVAIKAKEMVTRIWTAQRNELGLTKVDIETVELAGEPEKFVEI